MERKQDKNVIRLRFIVFKEGSKYSSICLDTNIAARANSMAQLHQKNIDASVLYLRSFTEEDILNKAYVRKSPSKYFLLWYAGIIIHSIQTKYRSDKAEFDPYSGKMSFA